MTMKLTLTPAAAGDVTGWVRMFGDWSLAAESAFAAPLGDCTVVLERVDTLDGNVIGTPTRVERMAGIVVAGGIAQQVVGTEFQRTVAHRLRCTAFTAAGTTVVLRNSGLAFE